MSRNEILSAAALSICLLAPPAWAAPPQPDPAQPGATVESVLAIAKRLSPELAAQALTTEAAQARVVIAGSLPDPKVQITSDELDRTSGPRQNKMLYSVEQEIPLWGKRDLGRRAAEAEVAQMAAQSRDLEATLGERVKVAFAEYYVAWQQRHGFDDLHGALHEIAQLARDRYALARGSQVEALRAELESTRVTTDDARYEATLRSARGRLNALLRRPLDAALAPPLRLRSLPAPAALNVAQLAERMRATNPALAADTAAIAGADANRRLAEKNWYPDVTIGAAAIDRTGNGPNGYQAWVSMKVPLQRGLHSAQTREAAAQAEAARARQQAREQQIDGDLAQAVADLQGSRANADIVRRQLIPRTVAVMRSGMAGYTAGQSDLAAVLQAEHDLVDLRLQLLAAELDEQRQLAAIERLIGSDL
jgi:outer membrane protein, heavy metal efflux system